MVDVLWTITSTLKTLRGSFHTVNLHFAWVYVYSFVYRPHPKNLQLSLDENSAALQHVYTVCVKRNPACHQEWDFVVLANARIYKGSIQCINRSAHNLLWSPANAPSKQKICIQASCEMQWKCRVSKHQKRPQNTHQTNLKLDSETQQQSTLKLHAQRRNQ